MNWFWTICFPFILAGVGAWMVQHYGYRLGLIDLPSERSSHQSPTPKGGGIGILVAFFTMALYFPVPWQFWLPAVALAILSLLGDRIDLNPKIRILVQFAASEILLIGIIDFDQNILFIIFLLLALPFFIAGTANFYNFMDGINGIAGITGVIGFGFLAVYNTVYGENNFLSAFAGGIAVACLGFLPWNFPNAKVFMGDVGSILLGFVFAGFVVWMAKDWLDVFCLPAFLFPFYADELVTMFERIRSRDSLTLPHRKHLYQVLANEGGISHWKISLGYGGLQLLVGGCILLLKPVGLFVILLALFVFFSGFIVVYQKIKLHLL